MSHELLRPRANLGKLGYNHVFKKPLVYFFIYFMKLVVRMTKCGAIGILCALLFSIMSYNPSIRLLFDFILKYLVKGVDECDDMTHLIQYTNFISSFPTLHFYNLKHPWA
ncbi:hypothetical protein K501DRAFT_265748 [Backusella circina FSU 941]|nr:hypothetical protein K501DRAFT_265748 [Backusella circina FSU 941]